MLILVLQNSFRNLINKHKNISPNFLVSSSFFLFLQTFNLFCGGLLFFKFINPSIKGFNNSPQIYYFLFFVPFDLIFNKRFEICYSFTIIQMIMLFNSFFKVLFFFKNASFPTFLLNIFMFRISVLFYFSSFY